MSLRTITFTAADIMDAVEHFERAERQARNDAAMPGRSMRIRHYDDGRAEAYAGAARFLRQLVTPVLAPIGPRIAVDNTKREVADAR